VVNEHRLMGRVLLNVSKLNRCFFTHLCRVQKRTIFDNTFTWYSSIHTRWFTLVQEENLLWWQYAQGRCDLYKNIIITM